MMRLIAPVLIAVAIECGCGGANRASLPTSASPVTPQPPLPPRTPPFVDLTGTYELTFVASPICSTMVGVDPLTHQTVPFPESARTRVYPAQITQDAGGSAQMVLRRGECDPCTADGLGGALVAHVSGRELTFSVPGSQICAGGDYWWEPLSADQEWLQVCGTWGASVDDPQHIAGIHGGTFAYTHFIDGSVSRSPHRIDIYCSASDHHFTLTKLKER